MPGPAGPDQGGQGSASRMDSNKRRKLFRVETSLDRGETSAIQRQRKTRRKSIEPDRRRRLPHRRFPSLLNAICHVERSRDISRCSIANNKRDSSTFARNGKILRPKRL